MGLAMGVVVATVVAAATVAPPAASAAPPTGTVRVFWLKPADAQYDQRYPDGIANVMRETQRYYRQELGRTFRLNTPNTHFSQAQKDRILGGRYGSFLS
jgi:hypothetical protein